LKISVYNKIFDDILRFNSLFSTQLF